MVIDVLPKIDLSIIVLFFLIIVIYLYKLKFNIKEKHNKIFITIMIISSAVLLLEILDTIILVYTCKSVVPLTKLINICGFILSPVVSYLWLKYVCTNLDINTKGKILLIPVIVNLLLSVATYNNGYIFSVDKYNNYVRGPLFMVPILATYLYFIITIYIIIKNKSKLEEKEYKYLLVFEVIPITAILFQVIFIELTLVWASVGISIIIYYLYIQEKLITYDNLTGVWNRFTFESYVTNAMINKKICFSLIYIDLDDFKSINDTYGHKEGDIALKNVAKFLKEYFITTGKVVRMGGDEFVIVVSCYDNKKLEEIVINMKTELNIYNEILKREYNIKFSCGYDVYDEKYEDLESFVKSVDKLMYVNKNKKKNKNN